MQWLHRGVKERLRSAGCSKGNGEFERVAATATSNALLYGMGGRMPSQPPSPFDGTWKTGTRIFLF
jgi:hypothetical protein